MQAFGFAAAFLLVSLTTWSQYPGYQQAADYTMTIVMDTTLHQYHGEMEVNDEDQPVHASGGRGGCRHICQLL